MTAENNEQILNDFGLDGLVDLFEQTSDFFRQRAAQSVNRELVVRNWLLGRYIVEFEQAGADRAEYAARLIQALANKLKDRGFKGGSVSSLKQIRSFYLAKREIGQTPSGFFALPAADTKETGIGANIADELPLSWSDC